MKKLEVIGDRYGRLTILTEIPGSSAHRKFLCLCDCGNKTEALLTNLRRLNHTTSCGCVQKARARKGATVHGFKRGTKTQQKLYRCWENMKKRCSNPNDTKYSYYGGRGIRVCDRWQTFENFRDDMWGPFQKHVKKHGLRQSTLDRIDSNGHYSPENCRWATWYQQRINQRRTPKQTGLQ